ncbi:hypothetical protein FXO38_01451 [Capsicum annuum]|nr:hypothetical protein FXO38_01451 [Capsicum annuum]
MGKLEGYGFEGENDMNEMSSAYSEYGDDEEPCDDYYGDVGACEESYTSHSEPRICVRYNPLIHTTYESYGESVHVEYENLSSSPCSTYYQGLSGMNSYTSYSRGCPMRRREYISPKTRGTHVTMGYTKPCNVDPKSNVHFEKGRHLWGLRLPRCAR